MNAERYLSLKDLKQRWPVSVSWLRRQIWRGNLKAVRFGHNIGVPLTEVQRFEASLPWVAK